MNTPASSKNIVPWLTVPALTLFLLSVAGFVVGFAGYSHVLEALPPIPAQGEAHAAFAEYAAAQTAVTVWQFVYRIAGVASLITAAVTLGCIYVIFRRLAKANEEANK